MRKVESFSFYFLKQTYGNGKIWHIMYFYGVFAIELKFDTMRPRRKIVWEGHFTFSMKNKRVLYQVFERYFKMKSKYFVSGIENLCKAYLLINCFFLFKSPIEILLLKFYYSSDILPLSHNALNLSKSSKVYYEWKIF